LFPPPPPPRIHGRWGSAAASIVAIAPASTYDCSRSFTFRSDPRPVPRRFGETNSFLPGNPPIRPRAAVRYGLGPVPSPPAGHPVGRALDASGPGGALSAQRIDPAVALACRRNWGRR